MSGALPASGHCFYGAAVEWDLWPVAPSVRSTGEGDGYGNDCKGWVMMWHERRVMRQESSDTRCITLLSIMFG